MRGCFCLKRKEKENELTGFTKEKNFDLENWLLRQGKLCVPFYD